VAPSDDQSKIVRVDYANEERMREAQEAQKGWMEGSFASHYLPRGRVVAYENDSETLKSIDQNRKRLGLPARRRGNKDFFELFFGRSDAPDTLTYVHNPDDGLVDWQPCMLEHQEKAKLACRGTGGQALDSKVESLEHDGKLVTTAVLANGDRIETKDADVVLAVGPWAMELLERSGIQLPPKDRTPVPTGLFAFQLQLNSAQAAYFRDKPMFSHTGRAEFLPPTQENGKAKITWVEPFTIAPIHNVSDSALARRALEGAVGWAREFLPRLVGAEITAVRFYCDGVTATQTPLIAKHPIIRNLILDCGGSYTRAKDLPTDGGYVTRLLKGETIPERLSWNGSTSTKEEHPHLVGRDNFDSMEEQARRDLGDRFPPIGLSSGVHAII